LAWALAERGLGAVELRLVGRRIDLEQHLAGLDFAAFGEQALEHHAVDARAHLRPRAPASTRPGSSVCSATGWNLVVITPTSAAASVAAGADSLDVHFGAILLHAAFVGVLDTWLFEPGRFDLGADAERYIDAALESLRCAPALRRA
jgi:hypothetical protein